MAKALNDEISHMNKAWNSDEIAKAIKKNSEILDQIRDNGAAVAGGYKAFGAVVD